MVSNYKQYLMNMEATLAPQRELYYPTYKGTPTALKAVTEVIAPAVGDVMKMHADAYEANIQAQILENPPANAEEYDALLTANHDVLTTLEKANIYLTGKHTELKRGKEAYLAHMSKQISTQRANYAVDLYQRAENQDAIRTSSVEQWMVENLDEDMRKDKAVTTALQEHSRFRNARDMLRERTKSMKIQTESELGTFKENLHLAEELDPSLTEEERNRKINAHSSGVSQQTQNTAEYQVFTSKQVSTARLFANKQVAARRRANQLDITKSFFKTSNNEMEQRGITDPAEREDYVQQKVGEAPPEIKDTINELDLTASSDPSAQLDEEIAKQEPADEELLETLTPLMIVEINKVLKEGGDDQATTTKIKQIMNKKQRNKEFENVSAIWWSQRPKNATSTAIPSLTRARDVGSFLMRNKALLNKYSQEQGRGQDGINMAREIFEGDVNALEAFQSYALGRGGLKNVHDMAKAEEKFERSKPVTKSKESVEAMERFKQSFIDDPLPLDTPDLTQAITNRAKQDFGLAAADSFGIAKDEGVLRNIDFATSLEALKKFIKAQQKYIANVSRNRTSVLEYHNVVDGQENVMRANDYPTLAATTEALDHIQKTGEDLLTGLDPEVRDFTVASAMASVAAAGMQNLKSSDRIRKHINRFSGLMANSDITNGYRRIKQLEQQEKNQESAQMVGQDLTGVELSSSGEPAEAFLGTPEGEAARMAFNRGVRFMNYEQLSNEKTVSTDKYYKSHIEFFMKNMNTRGADDPVTYLRSLGITNNDLVPIDLTGTPSDLSRQIRRRQTGMAHGRSLMNGEVDKIKLFSRDERAAVSEYYKNAPNRTKDPTILEMLDGIVDNHFLSTKADLHEIFTPEDVRAVEFNRDMFDKTLFGNRAPMTTLGSIKTSTTEKVLLQQMGGGNLVSGAQFYQDLLQPLTSAVIGTKQSDSTGSGTKMAKITRDKDTKEDAIADTSSVINANFEKITVGNSTMLIPKGDSKNAQRNIQSQIQNGIKNNDMYIIIDGERSPVTPGRKGIIPRGKNSGVIPNMTYGISQIDLKYAFLRVRHEGGYTNVYKANGELFTLRTDFDAS